MPIVTEFDKHGRDLYYGPQACVALAAFTPSAVIATAEATRDSHGFIGAMRRISTGIFELDLEHTNANFVQAEAWLNAINIDRLVFVQTIATATGWTIRVTLTNLAGTVQDTLTGTGTINIRVRTRFDL